MTAPHFNSNASYEPLNVFMIDCTASMLTKGLLGQPSKYSEAHHIAVLLRMQPNTLILGVSSEGVTVIDTGKNSQNAAGKVMAGGPPNASVAQDVIGCIKQVNKAAGQPVNIVYFTDETPKDFQKSEKSFLQALKKYTSSLDVVSRQGPTTYITPYGSDSSAFVPYVTSASDMTDLIEGVWKEQTNSVNNKLQSLMMKVDTDLKDIRDELSLEIEKRERAADRLGSEIEQKKKIHAEQKSEISVAKQRLAVLDRMIEAKNGKRPRGPSNKR